MLFTAATFAQTVQQVKLDSVVSVSMPQGFTKKDTLNQSLYSVNGLTGYMIVSRQANKANNTPLKKEKDLKNVMKKATSDIQAQVGGSTINNVRDTTINGLEARVFTMAADGQNGSELRDFLVMYTQDATYTFEYVYSDARKDMVKPEMKAFFSSIKVSSGLTPTDQYITAGQPQGSPVTKIAEIGGGAMLIAIILYFVFRKKERIAGV